MLFTVLFLPKRMGVIKAGSSLPSIHLNGMSFLPPSKEPTYRIWAHSVWALLEARRIALKPPRFHINRSQASTYRHGAKLLLLTAVHHSQRCLDRLTIAWNDGIATLNDHQSFEYLSRCNWSVFNTQTKSLKPYALGWRCIVYCFSGAQSDCSKVRKITSLRASLSSKSSKVANLMSFSADFGF